MPPRKRARVTFEDETEQAVSHSIGSKTKSGRRRVRTRTTKLSEGPKEPSPALQPPPLLHPSPWDESLLSSPPEIELPAKSGVKSKKKRSRLSNSVTNLLRSWAENQRQKWAELFVEVTELPPFDDPCCKSCRSEDIVYWCLDCEGSRFSHACLLKEHANKPLHRLKVRRGIHYERTNLAKEGLVVQLNHASKSTCMNPTPFLRDFTVVDVTGQHSVKIAYCDCRTYISGNSRVDQLFRHRWIPATWNAPRTVFTFDFLNSFHLLNLQSKCNLFDYYQATLRQTNNADLEHLADKYNEVSFAVRVWRDLKQLKRAGRVHDPAGVANMGSGALTTCCPACPDPDRNLPKGWDSVAENKAWLYEKIYALDACFKLSMKQGSATKRSNDDPELSSGAGVFVNEDHFQSFLKENANVPQETIVTCGSEFHAVNDAKVKAATKASSGRKVTGVAGIKCARHAIVERVNDLHYGERYIYVDYIIVDCLRSSKLKRVAFTYDIFCKWVINSEKRVRQHFPPEVAEHFLNITRRGFIPKLHLYAHGASCQTRWSLNYHKGVGRTDGESTERDWASAVLAALQTAEMNPGSRHAALDDHWIDRNFRRVVGLKGLLNKWLKASLKWSQIHRDNVSTIERGLEDASVLEGWKQMVSDWEQDHKKADPYAEPEANDTSKRLRETFKAEDAKRDAWAARWRQPPPDITSLPVFLLTGRQLRQRQHDLKMWIKSKPKMSQTEETALRNRRTTLQRDIYKWSVAQGEYMPHIKHARANNDFTFSVIHGKPPESSLMYVAGLGLLQPTEPSSTVTGLSLPSLDITGSFEPTSTATSPPFNTCGELLPDDVTTRTHIQIAPPALPIHNGSTSSRKPSRNPSNKANEDAGTSFSGDLTHDLMDVDNAENISLWLPSELPPHAVSRICSVAAIDTEFALLKAKLHDSLVNLRRYRCLYCAIRAFYKGEYKVGTSSANKTRKRREITVAGEKIELHKVRYQDAWDAAQRLKPGGDWALVYQGLHTSDIRGPRPGDDQVDLEAVGGPGPRPRDQGTGYYAPSWIWRTISNSHEPIDHVRVHWAKSNANAERWEEELALVVEEMRRTLESFQWRAAWWTSQLGTRHDSPSVRLSLALDAYAERQASIFHARRNTFATTWLPTLESAGRLDVLPLDRLYWFASLEASSRGALRASSGVMDSTSTVTEIDNTDTVCYAVESSGGMTLEGPPPVSAVPTGRHTEALDDDDNLSITSSMSSDASSEGGI